MHCVRHSARKFFISLYWSPVLISHKENLKLSEDGRRPPILSVMVISIIIFSKTTADPWSSGTFSTVLHVVFLRCAILLPYVLRSGHLRGDQLWYILPKGHIDIFFSKQALLPYCFPPTLTLGIFDVISSIIFAFYQGQASSAASIFVQAINPEGKYKARLSQ